MSSTEELIDSRYTKEELIREYQHGHINDVIELIGKVPDCMDKDELDAFLKFIKETYVD